MGVVTFASCPLKFNGIHSAVFVLSAPGIFYIGNMTKNMETTCIHKHVDEHFAHILTVHSRIVSPMNFRPSSVRPCIW